MYKSLTYSRVSCHFVDLLPVLICQFESRKLILLLANKVCFQDSTEDWEAILDVQGRIIAVAVHTCVCALLSPEA